MTDTTPAPQVPTGPGHDQYDIQGREVTLPLTVGHARAGIAVYGADAATVATQLPPGLRPVETRPGRTVLLLQLVQYVDNPLGDYAEGVVASVVRRSDEPGPLASVRDLLGGGSGVFVHHMPVDQAFTLEAGQRIWGYPKTLDQLDLRMADRRAGLRWATDEGEILELTVPRGGRLTIPSGPGTTWTYVDGQLWQTRLTFAGSGARVAPGGARLRLGTHPIAHQLRSLGLSRRALFTAWVEHATMEFGAAAPAG